MKDQEKLIKDIVEGTEEMSQLKPKNLTEVQKNEFFQVFRVLSRDLDSLRSTIVEQGYKNEKYDEVINAIRVARQLLPESNEEIQPLLREYKKALDNYEQQKEERDSYMEYLQDKYKRAEAFMDTFKDEIEFLDDQGTCNISPKLMFLVEYLQTLGFISEREQHEQEEQEQSQSQFNA